MSKTRLAAIMFTDIVGYTAMMQSNRDSAMSAVKDFEAVLKDRIASHSGELLQTYGDGSLSIFDSASAAVSCAKEIQEAIRGKVPLRIGIHMGEITIDGEHTFGDGVNIASRIESIGIDGAILMSSSIRQQIKNKPEFQLESLGKFSFKNVTEPMSVYALGNEGFSIPKPSEMKGKGEQVNNRETKSLFRIASLGFVTMVLGAGLFWMFAHIPTETEKLEEIKASRIAILPFENKTNDPKLDVLGDMAADHIIQGMMNLEDVKVVSYATIREGLKNADAQSEEFAERTGAQKLIRGNIYKEGDSLSIQSQIIDLKSNDVDMVIPEIRATQEEPRKLVGELRSRILGFFVAQEDEFTIHSGQIAPKLEAFTAYQKALQFFMLDDVKSREYLEEAIQMDSTYFFPYHLYFMSCVNNRLMKKADSTFHLMKKLFSNPNEYQRLYLDFDEKRLNGNFHKTLPELRTLFQKDPKNVQSAGLMAEMCMARNLPQEGLDAMSNIRIEHYPTDYLVYTYLHGIYAFQLMRKDRDTEAREVLNYVPMDNAHQFTINSRTLYHAKRGEADSISYFLDELEKYEYPPNFLGWRKHFAANYLAMYGNSLSQIGLGEELIADFEEGLLKDSTLLFDAFVHARQYDEALDLGEYLVKTRRNQYWRMARMGWIHGKEGRKEEARQMLGQLEDQFPKAYYQQAMIQTALGEKAEAVENLVKAFDAGGFYDNTSYDFEYAFLPLREYQPFVEKFMKPKG